jgi:hypothetical protein
MTCDELRPRAAGFAALPEDDPERREAFRHAEGCEGCRKALRQGMRLQEILLSARPLAAPAPEIMRRASREIRAELPPPRPNAWVLAPSVGLGFAAIAALRINAAHDDARSWLAALALGGAATALVTLSRRKSPLLVAGLAVASLVFAMGAGRDGGLEPSIGYHCVAAEILASLFPLGAALWLVKRGRSDGGMIWFASVAAAGALAGHAALHITCPVHLQAPHLYAFHTGGVVLAAFLGFLASRLPALLGWGALRRVT